MFDMKFAISWMTWVVTIFCGIMFLIELCLIIRAFFSKKTNKGKCIVLMLLNLLPVAFMVSGAWLSKFSGSNTEMLALGTFLLLIGEAKFFES